VNIGQGFKASKTSNLSKQRPVPSKAPKQKTATTNQPKSTQKEISMDQTSVLSGNLSASGKFSLSKTFGPWALAIACSATTGGQFHYAQPYAPS
jgi:lysozyme family protein